MDLLLITPAQLATLVGLATRTVYNRIHTGGDLPTVTRIGRRLPRFQMTDVHAWIAGKQTAPAHPEPTPRRPGRPTKAETIARRTASAQQVGAT